MFGYHDSPYCASDIWAPNPTAWGNNAIENRAFSPYAQHTQDVEDIINLIGQGYTSIQPETALSNSDYRYIESEVRRRYGLDVDLT